MRCFYHPKEDAVAICKTCGKGVCTNCAVTVAGVSYCTTCAEQGKVQTGQTRFAPSPTLTPKPSGIPSKTPFVIGGVGALLAGVGAILSLFGGLTSFVWGGFYGWGWGFGTVTTFLLAVGVLLGGFGYKGIKTNYGLTIGTAGFALGIVAFVFLVVEPVTVLALGSRTPYYYGGYYYTGSWVFIAALAILSLEMFAVTQIVWGVGHINSRHYSETNGLGLATGILLIVAGAFTASFILALVGFIMFLVAEILALIVFLLSKVPQNTT